MKVLRPFAIALTLAALWASPPHAAEEAVAVKLDHVAEHMDLAGNGTIAALAGEIPDSGGIDRVTLVDILSGETVFSADLPFGVEVSDLHGAPEGEHLYIFGRSREAKSSAAMALRLDLRDFSLRAISFPGFLPVGAIDRKGNLLIGDRGANILTRLDGFIFDKLGDGEALDASDALIRNFGNAPASDVVIPPEDVGLVLIAQDAPSALTVFDKLDGRTLNTLGTVFGSTRQINTGQSRATGKSAIYVPTGDSASAWGVDSVALFADTSGDALMLLNVDPDFRDVNVARVARLGLGEEAYDTEETVFLTGLPDLSLIIAGRSTSENLRLFRVGKAIEDLGRRTLGGRLANLVISAESDRLVALDVDRRTVRFLTLGALVQGEPPRDGIDPNVRTAQEILSVLEYPVGAVDGVSGPRTRNAIGLFQRSEGLSVTGSLGETTLARLSSAMDQAITYTVGFDATGSDPMPEGCTPVDQGCRRQDDFATRSEATSRILVCKSEGGAPAPVRADRYVLSELDKGFVRTEYQCTAYFSCGMARFLLPEGYLRACAR